MPSRDRHVPTAAPVAPRAQQRLCTDRAGSAVVLPGTEAAADTDRFKASSRAKERLFHPAEYHLPTAGCPAKPCPMAFAVLELGVSEWVAFIVGLVSQSKQEIKAEPFLHWRGARPETLVCRFAHLCLLLPHFYGGISSTQAIRFALPLFCSGTLAQAQLQIRLLEFFYLYLNFLFFSPAAFQRPVCKSLC